METKNGEANLTLGDENESLPSSEGDNDWRRKYIRPELLELADQMTDEDWKERPYER